MSNTNNREQIETLREVAYFNIGKLRVAITDLEAANNDIEVSLGALERLGHDPGEFIPHFEALNNLLARILGGMEI